VCRRTVAVEAHEQQREILGRVRPPLVDREARSSQVSLKSGAAELALISVRINSWAANSKFESSSLFNTASTFRLRVEALDRERFEPDGVRGSLHRLLVLELVLDDHAVDLPVAQARIVFDELDRFEDVEASLADPFAEVARLVGPQDRQPAAFVAFVLERVVEVVEPRVARRRRSD
jgi:hypothetical protein